MIQQNVSENIVAAVGQGVAALYMPEPLLCSEWAEQYFYLSSESSSIEGPWTSYPYQVAILNWGGSDDIEIMDVQKSARVGYTKIIMATTGYYIEHKKRKGLIYQPTTSDALDFVKDEVDPMLRDVDALRSELISDPDKKSPHNTNEKKVFKHSVLDIKGGGTGRNYRRMTKDFVIYDELDGFDQDIDREGSPMSLGDTRLETSSFPKSIRGTTPKVSGMSHIETSIDGAEMKMRRYIPCPHCGNMDFLKWANCKFDSKNLTEARFKCENCDDQYTWADYREADSNGMWISDNGEYYIESEDQFYNSDKEPIPHPWHIGVYIWSAYSHFTSWTRLAKKFLAADKKKKEGDLTLLKTFTNTSLGETWADSGESLDENVFDRRREIYPDGGLPREIVYLSLGADIQGGKKKPRVEYEVIGWGLGEESWSVEYGVIKGDFEKQDPKDHLFDVIKTKYTREDNVVLGIGASGIDSGHKTTAVYEFVTPLQRKNVYAMKGSSTRGAPLITTPSKVGPKKKTFLYNIGTDAAKETIYTRLDEDVMGPGYSHFPADRDKKYFDMFLSEEKKFQISKGVKTYYYQKKKQHLANEALDCRVYGYAAMKIANPNLLARKVALEREAERIRLNLPAKPKKTGRRVRSRGV